MATAPNAAPKNIAMTDSTLLANLGSLPFANEESAPMAVIVSVRTVVVRSGIASLRTAAFRVPIASAVKAIRANQLPAGTLVTRIESVSRARLGP